MNNIALGRYLPLNSVVDKMDPRAKILIMLLLMIAIFIPAGFWGYLLIFAFIWIALKLSKLTIGFALRSMKPMLFMMVFLLVINVFAIKTGVPLVQWGWFSIYSDAISQTVYIIVRLMLMVIITTIMTATTKPLDLTLGIEKLLKPFEVIGVPAHIIAMMISIALRFIPTLIEETDKIMKAQMARGADFESGNLMEKAKALVPILVPLFISAFRRADELATAMECRCYHGGEGITRLHPLHCTYRDAVACAAVALMLACVLAATIYM